MVKPSGDPFASDPATVTCAASWLGIGRAVGVTAVAEATADGEAPAVGEAGVAVETAAGATAVGATAVGAQPPPLNMTIAAATIILCAPFTDRALHADRTASCRGPRRTLVSITLSRRAPACPRFCPVMSPLRPQSFRLRGGS
jgi:hypothetical protein